MMRKKQVINVLSTISMLSGSLLIMMVSFQAAKIAVQGMTPLGLELFIGVALTGWVFTGVVALVSFFQNKLKISHALSELAAWRQIEQIRES